MIDQISAVKKKKKKKIDPNWCLCYFTGQFPTKTPRFIPVAATSSAAEETKEDEEIENNLDSDPSAIIKSTQNDLFGD